VLSKSFKGHDSTPLWWDFPLTDRASWEELKPRMTWNQTRIDLASAKAAYESRRDLFQVYACCCLGFEKLKYPMGTEVMLQTCGQNTELVPLYIEAGFDALNPLEVRAGMDLLALKREFGEVLTLWGGIDVRAIAHPDPSVLETETLE